MHVDCSPLCHRSSELHEKRCGLLGFTPIFFFNSYSFFLVILFDVKNIKEREREKIIYILFIYFIGGGGVHN